MTGGYFVATIENAHLVAPEGIRPGRLVPRPQLVPQGTQHAVRDADVTTACGLPAERMYFFRTTEFGDHPGTCPACLAAVQAFARVRPGERANSE